VAFVFASPLVGFGLLLPWLSIFFVAMVLVPYWWYEVLDLRDKLNPASRRRPSFRGRAFVNDLEQLCCFRASGLLRTKALSARRVPCRCVARAFRALDSTARLCRVRVCETREQRDPRD